MLAQRRYRSTLIGTFPCALARALKSAFNSDWVKLYLGTKNGQHVLGCEGAFTSPDNDLNCPCLDNEFTQLMKGLQGERLRQAFKYMDKDRDGFIRPEQFKRIMLVREPCHDFMLRPGY